MGNDTVIQLSVWQVLLAYVFVVFILFVLKRREISREKTLLLATFRMTLQLVVMGLVLTAIFERPHPLISFGIVLLMVSFSVLTVFQKFKGELTPALKKVVLVSLPTGGLVALLYFVWVVVRVEPYYNPQYIIPITGMIIGNSMTGITLGIHTLLNKFTDQKEEVIESLVLGATPKEASYSIINQAFDAAIMPTLNNMLGMGIIFLPGMMTGQILSGVVPTTAIMYQIGIMLGILGGVSLSTYIFLILGYKSFFNSDAQLIE